MADALGHYILLERIGVGGLGTVYRARDTRLGRTTAVKVVRPGLVGDPVTRQRFLRQATALTDLSHPNIETVFEVGEDDRRLFLAVEYVPGETLRSLIGGRPLNVRRAIACGIELAAGLADGHARLITHGDITSDNVMVTPTGHAKLLDFGLSAWTRSGEARRQTLARRVGAGDRARRVAACAAPEQVRGEPSDHRTDIFLLGIVLYEMLTGHTPFLEPSVAGTIQRIVSVEPPVPSQFNPHVPAALDGIVRRALSKRPDARYQDVAALEAGLREVGRVLEDCRRRRTYTPGVTPSGSRRRRMAVLGTLVLALAGVAGWVMRADRWSGWLGWGRVRPVIVMRPFEASDGLPRGYAAGLSDGLMTRLGQIPGLMVVGRSSARANPAADPGDLAHRLHAGALLAGAVRGRLDRIAIEVELRRAGDGRRMWRARFEGDGDRIFAVQTRIAEAVARALEVPLKPSAARARKKSQVVRPGAYASYVRGLAAGEQHNARRAIGFYEQAVAEDAGLAEATARLALALWQRVGDGLLSDDAPTLARIRAIARRALAADPDLPQAQIAVGLAAETLAEALTHLRRAIQIDPSSAAGYHRIASQLIEIDPREAIQYADRSLALDPDFPPGRTDRVRALASLDRFDEARADLEQVRPDAAGRRPWDDAAATLAFDERHYEAGLSFISGHAPFEAVPVLGIMRAAALQAVGRRRDAQRLARLTARRTPGFCEGRAMMAALTFDAGDRTSARRRAGAIFVAASAPGHTASEIGCAALAAAGVVDARRVAVWLNQLAAAEGPLRAWIRRRRGVSGWMALRRRWFPWNRVADRPEVIEAVRRVDRAIEALRVDAGRVLDGLLDRAPRVGRRGEAGGAAR